MGDNIGILQEVETGEVKEGVGNSEGGWGTEVEEGEIQETSVIEWRDIGQY